MRSIIIIAVGLVIAAVGLRFLVPALFSESLLRQRIAGGETDSKDNKQRRYARRKLIVGWTPWVIIGTIIVMGGIFTGFADRGDGLMLKEEAVPAWSANVTADGKYQTDNGIEYAYFVFIEGNKYYFCGELCENSEALEEKLSRLGVGNKVLVIDNYASAAAYKSVSSMLNEMGIKYETEER